MGDRLNRFSLTDRVAVVTGASDGIGKAIALGLAEAGAHVVVCSRREEKLKEVKAEMRKTGPKVGVFCPGYPSDKGHRRAERFYSGAIRAGQTFLSTMRVSSQPSPPGT